jgi:hypothetical protein
MNSFCTISKISVAVLALAYFVSCSPAEVPDPITTSEQYSIDSIAIAKYINEKGYDYSKLDTTSNLVIYTILEEGTGESLVYDDIVSYHFALSNIYDTLKFTNLRSLAIANDILDVNDFAYSSVKFTLASQTWTVPSLFSGSSDYGYKSGLVASMPKMKVGGRARLMIPSTLAFGDTSFGYIIDTQGDTSIVEKTIIFEANSVIIADIYPVFVRKATKN